jgi:hypothetical protein
VETAHGVGCVWPQKAIYTVPELHNLTQGLAIDDHKRKKLRADEGVASAPCGQIADCRRPYLVRDSWAFTTEIMVQMNFRKIQLLIVFSALL